MGAIISIIILTLIFLVMGILLFQGKCSWLIAGYNTLSKEEKEKYDERKLCRGTSIVCLVISIMLIIMAYLGYKVETGIMDEKEMLPFAIIFIAVVLATVGGNIYYSNKKCRKN